MNNSTTLTSSFEDSSIQSSGKSRHGQNGANTASNFAQNQANNESMPFNKNFAKTDSAALQSMVANANNN